MPTNTESIKDIADKSNLDTNKPAEPKQPASVAAAEATGGRSTLDPDEPQGDLGGLSLRAAEKAPEPTPGGGAAAEEDAAAERVRMGLSETAPATLGAAATKQRPHLGVPGAIVPNEE